ncbi:MAG: 1-deoxy-D-xylulose-5-phosphate reductoisomerase [Thermodesulfovibrionales bacterium]|nr:1-deoxy-D-xylulose-5-phosphate reductoisomerase [Thermodesulfovibrionales bacterium]
MKNIVILGSTGSIGQSALDVVSTHEGQFRVLALTGHKNKELMLEQVERFRPKLAASADPATAEALREQGIAHVVEGVDGLKEAASMPDADFVLSAIVGAAGLEPTFEAVRAGKTIGLANKETLVVAGDAVMEEARSRGVGILPVDSEHSAVFQCLEGRGGNVIKKIVLTASGGPFRGRAVDELEDITPEQALRHPSWSMGRKISIDSATLMNKGLEVIEAHHLFDVGPDRIGVVVHPQSIVHSMVEYSDGSVIAQMSVPDMRGAIAYAMSYPGRMEDVIEPLRLASVGSLTFSEPDINSFPCLGYAYDALKRGGTMPAVLNSANEVAVNAFLSGAIGFMDIPRIIKKTMDGHIEAGGPWEPTLDRVREAHAWADSSARAFAAPEQKTQEPDQERVKK